MPSHHPLNSYGRPAAPRASVRLGLVGLLILVGAGAIVVSGVIGRSHSEAKLAGITRDQAIPTVKVIAPIKGAAEQELVLPGDVDAYFQAPIFARVSGYVKAWHQDIGAKVKSGQLLAEIDTPDLDQQLAQAKADLATAKANAELAALGAKRWQALRSSDSVSQQSVDEKVGDFAAKSAAVTAAQANVGRLTALEGFKRITAPFDGVVTARKTDIGDLINAGSGAGRELFTVSDIHKMRVYVQFPQAFAGSLVPGMTATMKLSQYPDTVFEAKLVTTANAVAKSSRTVLAELVAENADGKLWSGTFAEVHFRLPANTNILHIPANSLLFRKDGTEVAVLGADGKVVLKPVELGRDLGTQVEVQSGLDPSDRVIDSPPDSVATGDLVRVADVPAQPVGAAQ